MNPSNYSSFSINEKDNAIRVLVATDNHLGYLERDPVRGQDSFKAFEEILKLAKDNQVDMILLGGDLFHENKPTRKTLYSTISLLRSYCMGPRQCNLQFLSDQSVNFSDSFSTVNYQDPYFNIEIPVFSIHGNHDDPSGFGSLAALDILAVSGYINYFGRPQQVDNIEVTPLLLQKGITKLAVYGLGHIREERLHRALRDKQVKMMRPIETPDEWFNLMVLHQNRQAHAPTTYVPENFLEDFLHLIIWGHEHECLIDPVFNSEQKFDITQPGSSVATSLVEGEATPKHVGILTIKGTNYELNKVRLRSIRPFIVDEIDLTSIDDLSRDKTKEIQDLLADKVNEMIQKATAEWKALYRPDESADAETPPFPLIRLKVAYDDRFTVFNVKMFGDQFIDHVANPRDLLFFYRKKSSKGKRAVRKNVLEEEEVIEEENITSNLIEYLQLNNLQILPENEFNNAVITFVEKEEPDEINDFYLDTLDRNKIRLIEQQIDESEERIYHEVGREKKIRREQDIPRRLTKPVANNDSMDVEHDQNSTSSATKSGTPTRVIRPTVVKSSRTKAPTKGTNNSRVPSTRGKKKTTRQKQEDDFDDELDINDIQEDSESVLGVMSTGKKSRPRGSTTSNTTKATRSSTRQKAPREDPDESESDEEIVENEAPASNRQRRSTTSTSKKTNKLKQDDKEYEKEEVTELFEDEDSDDLLVSSRLKSSRSSKQVLKDDANDNTPASRKRRATSKPSISPPAPKRTVTSRSSTRASSSRSGKERDDVVFIKFDFLVITKNEVVF
ncbi:4186_t:CDS:10 [Ambispora gerdemannii]|uniref:Double-strand break repair protein n=1 Tax=Ambispora gerdemannii TaxID=144530 RepID=A0A9N8W3P5_9GLOM|nr:4186_t:CDS:10 [Ambispora gerdemannii]